MPEPAYMRLRYRKQFIPGLITECGEDNLWEIQEFAHEISGKDKYDPWALSQWDTKHKILQVVLEVGAFLPILYGAKFDQGEYINRVEIFWRQYSEKQKKNHFYFKHTLYPVKITSIKMLMPNVKDPEFEQYNHLVAIEFRYRFIEHLYAEGYLHAKAEWHHFFFDESDEEIPEKYLTGRCLSHEALEWEEKCKKEEEEARKRKEPVVITLEYVDLEGNSASDDAFQFTHGKLEILGKKNTGKGTLSNSFEKQKINGLAIIHKPEKAPV